MSLLPSQTAWGEPLLDAQGLADALGRSRRWVYERVEQDELPHYKFGRSLLFEISAVRAWLEGFKAGDWSASREEQEPEC